MAQLVSIGALSDEFRALQRGLDDTGRRRVTRPMADKGLQVAVQVAARRVGADLRYTGGAGRGGGWPGRFFDDLTVRPISDGRMMLAPTRKSAGLWKTDEAGRNRSVGAGGGVTGRGGSDLFQGPALDRATGETLRTASGAVRRSRRRRQSKWSGYTQPKSTATIAVALMAEQVPPVAEAKFREILAEHFDLD